MASSQEILDTARLNARLTFSGQANVSVEDRLRQVNAFQSGVDYRHAQLSAELPTGDEGSDGQLLFDNLSYLLSVSDPSVAVSPRQFFGSRGGVGSFNAEVARLRSRVRIDASLAENDGEGDFTG